MRLYELTFRRAAPHRWKILKSEINQHAVIAVVPQRGFRHCTPAWYTYTHLIYTTRLYIYIYILHIIVAPEIRVRPNFYNIYSLFFFICLHTRTYIIYYTVRALRFLWVIETYTCRRRPSSSYM